MTTQAPPNKDCNITLRVIDENNWRRVANLSTKEGQRGNLPANVWSLCEAGYNKKAWPRAIYAAETPVGFLMLRFSANEPAYLMRFMIDGRYQGLGYGRRGIELLMTQLRQNWPKSKRLELNCLPAEGKKSSNPRERVRPKDSPFNFYMKLGFKVGKPDEDGNLILVRDF